MPARGGEPAGGGCGRLVRERARRQVLLGLTDLAHLHFTREFAASPLFPSYSLLPWLLGCRFATGCLKHEVGPKASEQ